MVFIGLPQSDPTGELILRLVHTRLHPNFDLEALPPEPNYGDHNLLWSQFTDEPITEATFSAWKRKTKPRTPKLAIIEWRRRMECTPCHVLRKHWPDVTIVHLYTSDDMMEIPRHLMNGAHGGKDTVRNYLKCLFGTTEIHALLSKFCCYSHIRST